MKKLILKCLLVYAFLPIAGYLFGITLKNIIRFPSEYIFFGVSTIVFYFLMTRYGGRRLSFIQTFTHELIHSLFVWASLGNVTEFHLKEKSGYIMSDRSNIPMTLAPYFFPLYTILLLSIRPGILQSYYPYFDIIGGLSFAFYLNMIKNQTGLWQTDIKSVDWRLSYPFLISMVFLCCYLVIESLHSSLWNALINFGLFIWSLIF